MQLDFGSDWSRANSGSKQGSHRCEKLSMCNLQMRMPDEGVLGFRDKIH